MRVKCSTKNSTFDTGYSVLHASFTVAFCGVSVAYFLCLY